MTADKKSFQIGNLTISPPLLSAPMAGVTNYPFRQMLRMFGGVGLIATEMVSARSFVYMNADNNNRPDRLWGVADEERPLAVQIWDNIPETLFETASKLAREYKVSVIDMNFGCPAPKIAKNSASGSFLLRDPQKVGDLVRQTREAAFPIPVMAKIRLGLTADTINAIDVAQAVEDAGGAALTVHGRTAAQMYRGEADWEEIAKIKPFLKRIPLIGNGDIRTPEEGLSRLSSYPVDGIMIGRASATAPWIFHQIAEGLAGCPIPPAPSLAEQKETFLKHFALVLDRFGPEKGILMIRSVACDWSRGKLNGRQFRGEVGQIKEIDQFLKVFHRYFSTEGENNDSSDSEIL